MAVYCLMKTILLPVTLFNCEAVSQKDNNDSGKKKKNCTRISDGPSQEHIFHESISDEEYFRVCQFT